MPKITKEKQLLTKEEFIQKCSESSVTIYCDRNDKLSNDQILQYIKTGYIDTDPPDCSHEESGASDLFAELRRAHYPYPLELTEDEANECMNSMSVDWDIKQLIRNTPNVNIHFQWVSNYDCINSHWFETHYNNGYPYGETYMSQVLKLLRISPDTFLNIQRKAGFNPKGNFPIWKKPPLVDPQVFWDMEGVERSAPESLFAMIGTLDLRDIETGKPPTKFKIPKGNCVGFYSSSSGGISQFATPLLEDYIIDISKQSDHGDGWKLTLEMKESVYYTIDNIVGVTQEFWKKPVNILNASITK